MNIQRTLISILVAIALGVLPTLSHAASITIGTPAATKNCIPFNCTLAAPPGLARYQQIYDRSVFPGPITITEISFFNDPNTSPAATIQLGEYTISLSTSPKTVGGLLPDFNGNLGPDNTLFFFGVRNDSIPGGQKFTILPSSGGQPFLYDPSLGDLLLDVQKIVIIENGIGGLSATISLSETSAIHNFSGDFADGLITEFSYQSQTPAAQSPEPGTMFLMGSGLLGLGAWRWKRHSARNNVTRDP